MYIDKRGETALTIAIGKRKFNTHLIQNIVENYEWSMGPSHKNRKTMEFPFQYQYAVHNPNVALEMVVTLYQKLSFVICSINVELQTSIHIALSNRCSNDVVMFLIDKSKEREEFSVYINLDKNQKIPLMLALENKYSTDVITNIIEVMERGINNWVDCFVEFEKGRKTKSINKIHCSKISANMQFVKSGKRIVQGIKTSWCDDFVWVIEITDSEKIVAQNFS